MRFAYSFVADVYSPWEPDTHPPFNFFFYSSTTLFLFAAFHCLSV